MHVGFSLLTLFPGRVGGSETYVRGLLGALGPEVELTVLGNRHVGTRLVGRAVRPVRRYRPGDRPATRFLAMNAGRVWPVLDGSEFDIAHYPVTVPVPRITGAPRVVTLLDLQHHELPEMFSAGERWLRSWAYDDSARHADRVITISDHARRGIVERLGIPAERVDAIPLAVDHEHFSPEGPARDDLGDYVLYPANLWPHKNHGRLLAAWRELDDLSLVLTGQAYDRRIKQSGVRHLGHVDARELPALYRGARAVVFPSLFEGFGLPILEAMACGVPVAASDHGAVAEVSGDAALLFDARDPEAIATAVRRTVSEEETRAELIARGLDRAARYTWRAVAAAHVETYAKALA